MKARQAFCYLMKYMAEDITRCTLTADIISRMLEQNLMTWKILFSFTCCNFTVHCSMKVEGSTSNVKSKTNLKHTTGLNFMWSAASSAQIIKLANLKWMGNYKLWVGKDVSNGMLYCKIHQSCLWETKKLLYRASKIIYSHCILQGRQEREKEGGGERETWIQVLHKEGGDG